MIGKARVLDKMIMNLYKLDTLYLDATDQCYIKI